MHDARAIAIVAVLAGAAACTTGDSSSPAPAGGPATYGEPLGAGETVSIATVVADPQAYADTSVRVSGVVRKACTKKGCWMELAASDAAGERGCRVTFKDYGFFVPTDSAGSSAVVEGVVGIKTVPKDHVEHLEAEGAHFATKNEDGSAGEVQIVATGVELSPAGS